MSATKTYRVAIFGLTALELRLLKSIALLSGARARAYAFSTDPAADIHLFDADDPVAVAAWKESQRVARLPFLAVSAMQSGSTKIIKRPIVPTRLLAALDELPVRDPGAAEPAPATVAASPRTEARLDAVQPAHVAALDPLPALDPIHEPTPPQAAARPEPARPAAVAAPESLSALEPVREPGPPQAASRPEPAQPAAVAAPESLPALEPVRAPTPPQAAPRPEPARPAAVAAPEPMPALEPLRESTPAQSAAPLGQMPRPVPGRAPESAPPEDIQELDFTVSAQPAAAPVPAAPTPRPPVTPPVAAAAPSVPVTVPHTTPVSKLKPQHKFLALVVDDSPTVRKQIELGLKPHDVGVHFAESAETALAYLATRTYDIAFLDVVLPGMDGYQVCKAIKRDKATRAIPVVMLTGRGSPFDKIKGSLAGCDTYLTKPVDPAVFGDVVRKYLATATPRNRPAQTAQPSAVQAAAEISQQSLK